MFSPKLSTAAFTDQTIGRSYDGAITRLVRIEAKAVGLLTVIAIAAAVTSAALTFENWWARGVGAVSMTYLAFASWGAMRMLRMASYEQVLSATALEPDGGRAATAAAASVIESMSPTHSNNVVGAIADLRVGGATALVASRAHPRDNGRRRHIDDHPWGWSARRRHGADNGVGHYHDNRSGIVNIGRRSR